MSSAARTNLSSRSVDISDHVLGEGTFRTAYEGTYRGGTRNQQEAACKVFKPRFKALEDEFYRDDDRCTDKAIEYAEEWNRFCPRGKEILITKGNVMQASGGPKYLVEPLIRDYEKFTSNNGWISGSRSAEAMEAFSHYTYHRSGGSLLVCDLQGRYRYNKYKKKSSRYELTDIAINSRRRQFGPTDMGEKGIETFFHNHQCNEFCEMDGERWQMPRTTWAWFESTSGTSMLSSALTEKLNTRNRTTFCAGFDSILEEGSDSDDDFW